jgi:hypothetical protein
MATARSGMIERLRVERSELGRDAKRVLEAVHRGETALVEHDGRPEAALIDIVDYRLLRAFTRFHARPDEHDLSLEPTDERFAGLDEQGQYDLVMAYYQTENMSIGRAAELLRLPMIEYQLRCARLDIPLYLGPSTREELLEEVRNAARFAPGR